MLCLHGGWVITTAAFSQLLNENGLADFVENALSGFSATSDLSQLEYGKSVTDGCISWETTEEAILKMHEKLKEVLPKRRIA